MKTTNFFIVMGLIFSISFLTSCEKEDTTTSSDNRIEKEFSSQKYSSWAVMRTFYFGPGTCSTPPTNCFPDVIISPERVGAYDELLRAVEEDHDAIAAFFNDPELWSEIWPDLDADEGPGAENIEYLTKLQSGYYDMIFSYDEESHVMHFIAGLAEYGQINEDNFEFVLTVDITELLE
jgi:hypothetical protein